MAQLCENEIARELYLQVDPNNLIEDQSDVIAPKLKDGDISMSNPALATGTQDLSVLLYSNFMDVFSYFLMKKFKVFAHQRLTELGGILAHD